MRTLAFTRFDLRSWLPRKQTLLPLAFIAMIGVALPVPGMAVLASAVVTSMMISVPFLADERGRLDTLYGVLPISRNSVVLGRAFAILVYYVISSVVALATTLAVALVRADQVPVDVVGTALAAGFAFIGLAMALQLPVLFRIGYSRGRLVAYAPALLVAALIWLNQATGVIAIDGNLFVPAAPVIVAGFGVGAAGFAVGVLAALRLYGRRELR